MNKFALEDQLTIVSTQTLHDLFQEENGADALALYMFYYYTAKWQKTNSVFATKDYCMKGLHWGSQRFINAKRLLIDLELVEEVVKRDGGKVIGWYVQLKYVWSREKTKEASQYQKPSESKTIGGFKDPNALSVIRVNALSEINKDTTDVVSSPILTPTSIKECVLFFKQEFDKKTGGNYFINWPKDMKLMKNIFQSYGGEETKSLIEKFFDLDDEFINKTTRDIGIFVNQINAIFSKQGHYKFEEPNKQRVWELAVELKVDMKEIEKAFEAVKNYIESGEVKKKYPPTVKTEVLVRKFVAYRVDKGFAEELLDYEIDILKREEPDKQEERQKRIQQQMMEMGIGKDNR